MTPQQQLDEFLDRYLPEIAADARACLKILRKQLPNAVQLVYDNYQALVIGFGPSDKASDAIFSLAIYPNHMNFFFLQGAKVPDPDGLLQGSGNVARHIRLTSPEDLNRPDVRDLMAVAMECARVRFDPTAKGRLEIRSISAKQRPRRSVT